MTIVFKSSRLYGLSISEKRNWEKGAINFEEDKGKTYGGEESLHSPPPHTHTENLSEKNNP